MPKPLALLSYYALGTTEQKLLFDLCFSPLKVTIWVCTFKSLINDLRQRIRDLGLLVEVMS